MAAHRKDGNLNRLRDRVPPPSGVLLVGINPGIRSAAIGHHFAGHSNRFWKLLFESGLVPEPVRAENDGRLPEWGYGITNVISRMTPGIDTLRPSEYVAGVRLLRRKARRWRPRVVAFLGVTLYRVVFECRPGTSVTLGLQSEAFEGSRVFVLPNPSGRNANYSYIEMLAAFTALRRHVAPESISSAPPSSVLRVGARPRSRPFRSGRGSTTLRT